MSGIVNEVDGPISEDWLRGAGFRWHQLERQPGKHWLLWLGAAVGDGFMTSYEDLGIEVAAGAMDGAWFCWLRSDAAGRYHRFIHLRHLQTARDLVAVIQGVTGIEFNPENNLYGVMRTQEEADRIRCCDRRLDRVLMRGSGPWSEIERDDTRGRALPEHMAAAEKARLA